ncbi:class I SAM-dependent methyltransferase [Pseudonocardia xishanensis]|uniref:Methyltransferase domain-containing protein n=1 Tax=Pseudonocardia xishanensis TaxID=630995 RepID=A0ABP8RXL5_9PSEU
MTAAPARRRRGPELEAAIRRAVLAPVIRHGPAGVTMEAVAAEAGTSARGRAPEPGGDTMIETAPGNDAQLAAWDGAQGTVWATHAAVLERTAAGYDPAFLDAARLGPGRHVLDVGCGTGATVRAAAERCPGGTVLGVDLSAAMLARARRDAPPGTTFLQADAQIHPFPDAAFDRVLSRTGAMFFADPDAAFANLARALRPGGRMTLLTWQAYAENPWLRELARAMSGAEPPVPPPGPGPFGLSDPDRIHTLLTGAGLVDVRITGLRAPHVLGRDPAEAEAVVTDLMGWLRPADRPLDDLRDLLRARTGPDGVAFGSAAWLVTADRPAA